MPSFLPMMTLGLIALELDLDVHAGGEVEPHQRVDRLGRGLVDVDQPLVRADLEVLARVLVLEGGPDHAVDVLLRRQGHGAGDGGPGALRRVDDVLGRLVELLVVVALEPDPDLLLCRHVTSSGGLEIGARWCHRAPVLRSAPAYLITLVTAPAPTVRPPSRMAKRSPSSMAIGWISSIVMTALSPGMHISTPSWRATVPVTSV